MPMGEGSLDNRKGAYDPPHTHTHTGQEGEKRKGGGEAVSRTLSGLTLNEDAWRLRRGQMGSDKLILPPGN